MGSDKIILFGRHQKSTKLEWVKNLTTPELLTIPEYVFQRILKDVGDGFPRERTRRLQILGSPGNEWNSEVTEIYRTSGRKLGLLVYHQLSSTDEYITIGLSEFMSPGDWRGRSEETDKYGGKTTRYCVYTPLHKAEVIRAILVTYLERKYPSPIS